MIWHLRRLAAMSWEERRLRVTRAVRDRRHRTRLARGGPEAVTGPAPPPDEFHARWRRTPWILSPERLRTLARTWPPAWRERTLAEADEIQAGRYRWLGGAHELGPRPDWRREPVSGTEFPARHWSLLPFTSPTGAFDLKHLWEPNLHPAFATLAKAYLLDGEEARRDHLALLWNDWMEQNPPLTGPNYIAPVEIGLRLLHWGAALRFWAAREAPPRELLDRVWRHAFFQRFTIAGNLSRGSSANNHLLGELASLVLADAAFPGLAPAQETAGWERELRREVLRQFHPDGGNREQAFHYHAFSLAFALLAREQAVAAGRDWDAPERERLERATAFLDAGLDARHRPFLYGDCDESEVLPLAEGVRNLYLSTLAHGRLLTGEPAYAEGDERAAWLRGKEALPDPSRPPRTPPGTRLFPGSGHAFLRAGEIEVHGNAGELGYLSIAAHAHADALSVSVRAGGEPLVVDPGTFSYRGGNRFREWLVSTAAHPTLTVNGEEQAERRGPFLWSRPYTARLEAEENGFRAGHDAYRRLGIVHRRRAVLEGNTLLVEDVLEGSGRARVRLSWPFSPGEARREGDGVALVRGRFRVTVAVEGMQPGRIVIGDPDLPGTPCVSPGYDRLQPAAAYVLEEVVEVPFRAATRITIAETC